MKILSIMKEDARIPYTEMAKTFSLSEGAVRQRVKNLIESGIIRRFTVETSENYPRAIVFISTSSKVPVPSIVKNILSLPGVESLVEVAGQFDISVVVSGQDISSVNQCIDAIREIEGVQATNTLFVLRSWK
ncbi:Lrp/AsnC family transcriptional regulator [Candidatus Bathyarchaeota archaeon]|nr:Lrp/AsnC family transcriptional regulator [Candidatus Bathyarchaeota archaeon]